MDKRYNFNLIEIVLTIAVVAFGVVIILGMLPKGMTASRNAAAASYASSVIEQFGGALQLKGAASIASDFDDVAIDHDDVNKNYAGLVADIDGNFDEEVISKFTRFSAGVFKHKTLKDVYVAVMGNSEEIDGERITNVDFSGMIRVCKKNNQMTTIGLDPDKHEAEEGHTCLADDGKLKTDCQPTTVDQDYKGTTVYMELSYPLSLPYADRTKLYYSFDVKK